MNRVKENYASSHKLCNICCETLAQALLGAKLFSICHLIHIFLIMLPLRSVK